MLATFWVGMRDFMTLFIFIYTHHTYYSSSKMLRVLGAVAGFGLNAVEFLAGYQQFWLVGGDWNMTFIFPDTGNVTIPIDELIFFQRGYLVDHPT